MSFLGQKHSATLRSSNYETKLKDDKNKYVFYQDIAAFFVLLFEESHHYIPDRL